MYFGGLPTHLCIHVTAHRAELRQAATFVLWPQSFGWHSAFLPQLETARKGKAEKEAALTAVRNQTQAQASSFEGASLRGGPELVATQKPNLSPPPFFSANGQVRIACMLFYPLIIMPSPQRAGWGGGVFSIGQTGR